MSSSRKLNLPLARLYDESQATFIPDLHSLPLKLSTSNARNTLSHKDIPIALLLVAGKRSRRKSFTTGAFEAEAPRSEEEKGAAGLKLIVESREVSDSAQNVRKSPK